MGFLEKAKQIVGPDYVSTSPEVIRAYAYNCFLGNAQSNFADMIVMPKSSQEISDLLKAANRYKVHITPKGNAGGTGHGGPMKGGVLLDLSRMDKVLSIDPVNYKAVAEAGCSFFKLSQEVFKAGMMIPTTEYSCGPNVAASAITPVNAFGKTRYGRNCELVEGFEVVLPNGEIIRVGSLAYEDTNFGPFYRYVHGPDLVGLFVMSNGAYGIVTKVAYACQKRPDFWGSRTYSWKREEINLLTDAMLEATALELFDIHLNDRWKFDFFGDLNPEAAAQKLPKEVHFTLLVTLNAFSKEEMTAKENIVDELMRKYGGTLMGSLVADQYFSTWPTFHSPPTHPLMVEMFASLYPVNKTNYLFIFDSINYPTSKFPAVYDKLEEVCTSFGLWGPPRPSVFDCFPMKSEVCCSQTWSIVNTRDKAQFDAMYACRDKFRDWFGAQGGTHQQHLPPRIPPYGWLNQLDAYDLCGVIKKVLDPNNILSPGTFNLEV
ncbi:MAG: FAD-binding oxidoreductase [Clostridiales bacterium]|jgi:hypothetical protein|nr:FAD-binding oxidoreductase [Clostridiales bacterium]